MKISKRILAVRIKHMVDEGSEPSDYLGQYARSPTSEFSIDRAHTEDCASVKYFPEHRLDAGKVPCEFCEELECDYSCDESTMGPECDCGERGSYSSGEYRYYNPSCNYVDKHGKALPENTPEEIRKYVREDYQRHENWNNQHWYYLGIRAEADVQYPAYGGVPPTAPKIVLECDTIKSMGLWGIESDSEKSDFAEVAQEELGNLRAQLTELGFSKRAIATAFKSIKEVNE